MSFSQEVKNELCTVKPSGCCQKAECYGILLLARQFGFKAISLTTENQELAVKSANLIKRCFDVEAKITSGGRTKDMFKVSVENEEDRLKVLLGFGLNPNNTQPQFNERIISKECCQNSFVRGAFLASGSISDPIKNYRAEITAQNKKTAEFVASVLNLKGLTAQISKRTNGYVVYFKESENVEDFLTLMNATSHTLEVMNMRIYKDMRNRANRIRNCEDANISKTVNASFRHKKAIAKIKASGMFELLPDELKEAANLRIEYEDESLTQLCELSHKKINRSQLNYRLNKLVAIAENLKHK